MKLKFKTIAPSAAALVTGAALAASDSYEKPPVQVDPTELVNALEAAGGKSEGYRRGGAKGVCAMAEFVGSAEGRALSVSSAFSGQSIPVTGSVASVSGSMSTSRG